jgi:hypothetical protein
MSERDICERLEARDYLGDRINPDGEEAATTIRTLRDTLRRADELLLEGVIRGPEVFEGQNLEWRARAREFLEERS